MFTIHCTGRRFFTLVSACSILLFLNGCISPQQYRNTYQLCSSNQPEIDCPTSSLQRYSDQTSNSNNEYLLGFAEFDDQGQLWDRKQKDALLDQIYQSTTDTELLMVVFVHGWKHSAKAGDTNIGLFHQQLKRLSAMETEISRKRGAPARKVVGIYLGWRGGSVSLPLLKELTFWSRKSTAHKVGYGGVTEVLSELELIQKTKQYIASQDKKESSTRLIVVGHSFGGAVVYSALSEILENGFVQTRGPAGTSSNTVGFADLVVLINPAFEALRFANLSDMSTERATYFCGQLPALAVLTSEADYATKLAFPAGRWLGTLFERERDVSRENNVTQQLEVIDQGSANVTTIGHFKPYRTHYLRATDKSTTPPIAAYSLQAEVSMFEQSSSDWNNDKPGSNIAFNGSMLERSTNSAGRNPYLNIYVDKKLIPGHNQIDDPRIGSFISQLILISSQNSALDNNQVQCASGSR